MRLEQIWTYPIKSMLGDRVPTARLDANGIVGDRIWALRDEQRDAIASARRIASLSRLAAAITDDGATVITLPDGSRLSTTDDDIDERLSAELAHPVTLHAKQPAENLDFYRRAKPDNPDIVADLRAIFGRLEDEPLPDFSVFPPEMVEYEYPPGNYFDCYPLLVMTAGAMRALRDALPDSVVDERRFRPSLVIDTGDDTTGHAEFAWTGCRLRIGATEIRIGSPCPRCVAVTREFGPDMPVDRAVLRHVVRDLDQNVGMYATVTAGGQIAVGDTVELLGTEPTGPMAALV